MTKKDINQTINGKKEGRWVAHYADGKIRSEGWFKAGEKDGKWTLYWPNGNLQSEATFVNGKYSGHYVSYHKNGKKFREGEYNIAQGVSADGTKDGLWYQYLQDGETVEWWAVYKRGSKAETGIGPKK